MVNTINCKVCGRTAEYSHTESNKKGKFDVYYCPEGHETKVKIGEATQNSAVPSFPHR